MNVVDVDGVLRFAKPRDAILAVLRDVPQVVLHDRGYRQSGTNFYAEAENGIVKVLTFAPKRFCDDQLVGFDVVATIRCRLLTSSSCRPLKVPVCIHKSFRKHWDVMRRYVAQDITTVSASVGEFIETIAVPFLETFATIDDVLRDVIPDKRPEAVRVGCKILRSLGRNEEAVTLFQDLERYWLSDGNEIFSAEAARIGRELGFIQD